MWKLLQVHATGLFLLSSLLLTLWSLAILWCS